MSKIVCLLIGNIRYDGRVKKEVHSLSEAGHNVTLIVSKHDNDDNNDYHCKLVLIPRNNGGTFIHKLWRNFFYIFYITKAVKNECPDYVHCNDLNTLILTLFLPSNIKRIYDSHELYPETRNSFASKIFFKYAEKYLIYKTHKVIVPQIDRLNYMFFKYKLPKTHYVLLENFPSNKTKPQKNFWERKFDVSVEGKYIISYIGAISKEREVDTIIRSMNLVDKDAVLFVVGNIDNNYSKHLIKFIEEQKLDSRVYLFNRISHDEVLDAEFSSDLGICFYNSKTLNSYFCAPNKIYEYLDYGAKVITNNIAGVARVLKHGENGYVIDDISEENISKCINDSILHRNDFAANYYWENQENRLLEIYKKDEN